MRGKNKIKILLSLLIAVSFMITSTSVIGSNISTEKVKASAVRPTGIQPTEKVDITKDSLDGGMAPLTAGPIVLNTYDPSAVKNAQVRYRNFKTQGNGWDYAIGTDVGVSGYMTDVDWTYSANWFFTPNYNTIAFVYDGSSKVYTNVVVNGVTYTSYAEYLTGDLGAVDYMQWLVRGSTGQTVDFYDVVLTVGANSYPLGSYSKTASDSTWSISNFDFSGGFTLTGKIKLTGQTTCQECGKVDIVIGDLPYNGPFPVGVTAISVDGIDHDSGDVIASGTYPLDVTVCRLAWPEDEQYPAIVKKFIEVFKKKVIPGTPNNEVDLYCEDFEDPCEIALNWATLDMPVWGYNGALDTWTWSAKRFASPGHSMHSTSFDQYLPNQWDILALNFGSTSETYSYSGNILGLGVTVEDAGDWLLWTYTYAATPTHTPKMTVSINHPTGFAITTFDDGSHDGWYYAPDGGAETKFAPYSGGSYGGWVETTASGNVLTVKILKSHLGDSFHWHGYANYNGLGVWINADETGTGYGIPPFEVNLGGAGLDVSAYDSINITWKQFVQGDKQGVTLQDYGYFEYSIDGGAWTQKGVNYYDSDGVWETIHLNIPNTGDSMRFRWTWISDPVFCYEGWFIDDVCLTGIIGGTPGTTTWEFVMDSYSYPQTIEGPCETYVFNESWTAVVGEYRICAWIQALDADHFSTTEYDFPYCIYITIGNHLELEIDCGSVVITPPSPAFEGDDVTETVDVCNIGTLDATNVQVQMMVNRGSLVTEFSEGFEGLTNQPDGTVKSWQNPGDQYPTEWVKNWQGNTRSWAHFTSYDATEGTQSLANFKEVGAQPWKFVVSASTSEYTRGPYQFKKSDKDLGYTATFDVKANLGAGERFLAGIWDWTLGSGSFWYITPYGPTWIDSTVTIDLSGIIAGLGVAGDDYCIGFLMYKNAVADGDPTCPWNAEWCGYMVDNIYLTSLVAEPEVIYQQTNVIPFLNITDCVNTEFNWLDAGVGRYVITTQILTADEDDSNNMCTNGYDIINTIITPDDLVCVDYTGPGQGHWVEEGCCGGYFWCGDPVTTQYGINWSDALFLKNATGGLTFDMSAYPMGVNFAFDTWYQMNASDFGYVQYSLNNGITWVNAATYTGKSPGVDGWLNILLGIPTSATMQIRFLFESNATVVNRGWLLDNIHVWGGPTEFFGPDPCLNFNKFYRHEKQYGCWWTTPWIYDYYYPPDPRQTYGCFDDTFTIFPGSYPDNIDNALIWTLDIPHVFYGYLDGYMEADLEAGDVCYMDVSNDGGANWVNLDTFGTGWFFYPGPWSLADYIDDTIQIRWRMTSDASNPATYFGPMWAGMAFYGMEDLNPPVTTLQMSGTFDETYHYYTSTVKMKLTATDDITGVAHTYYKLDGVQSEYTGLVSINTDGTHTFSYWSVDNEGNVEAEKSVPSFRIDLTGPTVTITGPTAGLYLFGSQILPLSSGKIIFLFGGIPVTATATSTEAPIQVVRFFLDDVLLAEDSTAPYAATLSAKHSGAAVIKVTARDVLGHEASATLNIDTYVKLL